MSAMTTDDYVFTVYIVLSLCPNIVLFHNNNACNHVSAISVRLNKYWEAEYGTIHTCQIISLINF